MVLDEHRRHPAWIEHLYVPGELIQSTGEFPGISLSTEFDLYSKSRVCPLAMHKRGIDSVPVSTILLGD